MQFHISEKIATKICLNVGLSTTNHTDRDLQTSEQIFREMHSSGPHAWSIVPWRSIFNDEILWNVSQGVPLSDVTRGQCSSQPTFVDRPHR